MKTSGCYRSPVAATTYAEHCAAQTNTITKGLYTAYTVVDYKRKDTVEPPTEFQWHGDPGAILFKAQKFLAAELSGTLRIPHMQDLKAVRTKLWELRGLREEGNDAWAAETEKAAAHETSNGPRPGPSGSTCPLKRKRAASDCSEETLEDAVRVGTTCKRVKSEWTAPHQLQEPSPQHQQRKPALRPPEPCRWGGPTSSTEETVRYWNAIFGHAYTTADRCATEPP